MRLFVLAFGLFFGAATFALAQADSSTFYIRVFGTPDVTPPSTPTLTSVTPVSTDQIDVVWTASTDDRGVSGYSLSRDGVPVATTTLTSYSDSGLSASTTYAYVVRAFDAAFNYSSTSNSLSTTTFAVPPPTPTSTPGSASGNTGGGVARVVLDELSITSDYTSAVFAITTARPARFEIRWGRTASYELGYVATNNYLSNYLTTLTDLEPGTTYEYELIGYTPFGIASVLKQGRFTTKMPTLESTPQNISRFSALASDDDAVLAWTNPPASDFAYVRIVRSHLGFPAHPQDGAIIYQGTGEGVTDYDVLRQYSPIYYTAFVYDSDGNVSSGAVALVYAVSEDSQIDQPSTLPPALSEPGIVLPPFPTLPNPPERTLPDTRMPELFEITLSQEARTFSFIDTDIVLDEERPFVISIPIEAVAKNLKSIIVTLTDPTDNRKAYSFLLRINKDGTAYEAVIAPLKVTGASQIKIRIYDYEAFVVGKYDKNITFVTVEPKPTSARAVFPDIFFSTPLLYGLFGALILLLFLFFFFLRRRDEDKKREVR
ncbi:MAG: fibronectin type III domain-containing protein [Patescibacteria group bacterium]